MKYTESLKKNNDFRYVYKNGVSFANKYLILYVIDNESNIAIKNNNINKSNVTAKNNNINKNIINESNATIQGNNVNKNNVDNGVKSVNGINVITNDNIITKLGISVSKKVGNSIVRHRVTRLIRESYRLNEEKFMEGLTLVFIARVSAKGKSYSEIESAVMHLAR
ncbi:MAG: ribonuclease P protein component, partial [Bacillales bacterium]|nr:ribonuclease P protein component [Bacillales bacterium]